MCVCVCVCVCVCACMHVFTAKSWDCLGLYLCRGSTCPLAKMTSSFLLGSNELCSSTTKRHEVQIQTSKKEGRIKAGFQPLGKASMNVCTKPSRPTWGRVTQNWSPGERTAELTVPQKRKDIATAKTKWPRWPISRLITWKTHKQLWSHQSSCWESLPGCQVLPMQTYLPQFIKEVEQPGEVKPLPIK